ncbi:phosphotransferase family protein [Legionella longbeachae]|uniref:phosphotransferase family protein n=1 Tax=Legionella longbeachae TaxID=450 RepID=UPI0012448F52|nr:hypothetical protein [Legionella longbeachae]QEY52126.1 hypothetical protein FQU71_13320 [Legionella longbeachae]
MREKGREIDPVIREKALEILQKHFEPAEIHIDSAVYLSEPERRNIILRLTLTSSSELVPKSIILKQSLPQREDTNNQNAAARFFRDWAAIEFSSRIEQQERVHNTPLFYGSDTELRFILIEDLGHPHISLVDSLAPSIPNSNKAFSALERYMKVLGAFNAMSYGNIDSYDTILKSINRNATTPEEDMNSLSEHLLPILKSTVELLGISVTQSFTEEVREVLEAIFKPGPFTVLTHGDIAPDNVFDHKNPKGLQLIDFEWSSPRNALLDGTYLRMSMPTAWFAKSIPEAILKPLELIYRNELKKTIPQASDDMAYSSAFIHACAFYVLQEMSDLNQILEKDIIWGSGPVPKDSLWERETNSVRSRFLTRLQTFVDITKEHDNSYPGQPTILPQIRRMAEEMLGKVSMLWPDTKPLGLYPAFKSNVTLNDTAQLGKIERLMKEDSVIPLEITQKYKTSLSFIRQDSESVVSESDNISSNFTP